MSKLTQSSDQRVIERIKKQISGGHVFRRQSELLTPKEAAKGTPYTPNEVGMLVKLGLITGRKLGRTTYIDAESFHKLLAFKASVLKLGILWDE